MNGKGSMNTHKQVILLSCNRGKFKSAAHFTFCATQKILVEELQQWEVMKSPPHSHQNVFSLCCYFSASLWPLPFTLCGDGGSKWGTDLLPSCSVSPLGKTGRSLACYPHAALPGSCQAQSRGRGPVLHLADVLPFTHWDQSSASTLALVWLLKPPTSLELGCYI